jgi:sugar lactone lactonase YvrE
MRENLHSTTARVLLGILLALCGLVGFLPLDASAQGIITTIAGGGSPAGPALSAEMVYPSSVVVDKSGNLYVAALELEEVLKIDTSGNVTVVAGTGYGGFSGDGGPATSAALDLAGPYLQEVFGGLALDSSGNLFITDSINQRIRRVDASTGIITTVAGNGTVGYSGDGGPAINAGFDYPDGLAVDAKGNLFIADGNSVIRRVDAVTGIITTVAGNYSISVNCAYSGDSGPATGAGLCYPTDVAVDSSGNLFIADQGNNVIRRVDGATGIITTSAGNYSIGGSYSGDTGLATSAALNQPGGIALDASGNVFITDSGNNAIRRVDAKTQIITTVAGNGTGAAGYSGDNGPATSATLNLVEYYYGQAGGVAVDPSGDLFIPDLSNNRVRRVDGTTGIITTFAGGGSGGDGGPATSALTVFPASLALDSSGNIFIDDLHEARVRRVDATTGAISTVAGNGLSLPYEGDGGPATSTSFFFNPFGIAVDSSGNLFISDNWNCRIRRVDASSGIITTVAGTGACGYNGDGDQATSAELEFPHGVAVDTLGTLFINDRGNNRIRRVDATTGIITTVAGNGTAGYGGDGGAATSAELRSPSCVALDTSDDIFICDGGGRVRRVDAKTGIITTVAGNGTAGFSGDGGLATSAGVSPEDVAVDTLGNLFIADAFFGQRIRRVDALTGIISTVAGSGPTGYLIVSTFSGDGGAATNAILNYPYAIAIDTSGDLLIGDAVNNRVREVSAFPFASLLTTSIAFGNQALATTSAPQTVTLTNTGAVALNVSDISASGDFSQTNNCGGSVAAGSSCTINVTFSPTATGSLTGTLTITDNTIGLAGSTQSVDLTGTGTAPVASVSPPSLTFGDQNLGTTSASLPVTLSNTGNAALTITSIAPGANFSESDNCAGSVAAGGSCTINVTFSPTATGPITGTLTIIDNSNGVAGSQQTVSLAGVGTSGAASVSPASRAFGAQALGTTSAAKTFTLSSTGTTNLNLASITIAGTNAGDFAETDTCPASLAPGVKCTLSVTFTPSQTGAETAGITFADSAVNSPQTVALSGTGVLPVTLLPASPSFGKQAENTTSAAKTLTLTNNLDSALAISSITTSGDFAQTNTCGNSVAANSTCTISVTFTPSIIGADAGTLSVTDGASSSPQTASLSGTGVLPVTLLPASPSFGKQAENTTSEAKTLTLTNTLDSALAISSITTSGDFAQTNTCGSSVPANSTCTISVTFTPSIIGAESGTLTVTDAASNSPQTAALAGTGIVQAKVAPISLTFAKQTVGSTSAGKNVTLTNNLSTALPISITFTGANPGDFAETDTCSGSVAAGASCTITVTFTPAGAGTRTATLNVNDSANNSPQTVSLTGTGH